MAKGRVRAQLEQQPDAALAARLDARFRSPLMSFFLRREEELPSEFAEVYIFKVAANLLRDRARQAASRQKTDHFSIDEPQGADGPADLIEDLGPERVLLSQEALAAALQALDTLGERTRDIFVLYRLENMKQREIAALYGISVSLVEKSVARATEHLSTVFGPL